MPKVPPPGTGRDKAGYYLRDQPWVNSTTARPDTIDRKNRGDSGWDSPEERERRSRKRSFTNDDL